MSTAEQLSVVLPRRGRLTAAVVTMRPRQWVKNALVIAAAGAAGALGHDDVPGRVAAAAIAFCLLSAGLYALNDVHDAAEDRLHPRKRFRPVAAGELSTREAVLLGLGSLLAGLALCAAVRPLLLAVGAGYVALTLSYTWLWRRLLVLRHRRHRRRLRAARTRRRRGGAGRAVAVVRAGGLGRRRCSSPPASVMPS